MNLIRSAIFEVNGVEYVVTGVWISPEKEQFTRVEFQTRKEPFTFRSMEAKEFLEKTNGVFQNNVKDNFYQTKYKEHSEHPTKK